MAAVLILAGTSVVSAMPITFSDYPLGTEIDDEYIGEGVVFSTSGVTPAVIYDLSGDAEFADGFVAPTPTSTDEGLRINSGVPWTDSLILSFVDPVDQVTAAYVTTVSFSYVSDRNDVGSIRAYDELDNQIDSASSALGGPTGDFFQEYETLTVSGAQIWRVEIDGFADVAIDVLTFDEPQTLPIPEPATFALLGIGLIGMALIRSKRRG